VRNREPGLVDHLVAVQEQIEVDRTRTVSRPGPIAPEPALDGKKTSQELERSVDRLDGTGRVQEARLIDVADWIGFAEGRHRNDPDALLLAQEPNALPEVLLSISEVRAKRYVRADHGPG
jgi:hypothetical protein